KLLKDSWSITRPAYKSSFENTGQRGPGHFKQSSSTASFQHGVLESKLTRMSLEHPDNLILPAIYAGMTTISIFMLCGRAYAHETLCGSFQIVRHCELLAHLTQAFKHCAMQRDPVLGSLLRSFIFNLACHITALLACDGRRRFQFSDQPIHVLLEFIRRSECIDAKRAKEMTARILIGVERSHRAGQHTTKNLHENRETVALVAAAFTRSTEG